MRDFLKYAFASVTGFALFSLLAVVVAIAILVGLINSSSTPEPQVEEKTILVFDLSTNITDAKPDSSPIKAMQSAMAGGKSRTISLSTVLDCLDKASKDKRIVGLYMYGNLLSSGYGSGFATLKEIREALEHFKSSGKTITAYDMGFGEREYYLASVANNVVLNPFGAIEMNGFVAQPMFFADAFKKYGIGVQTTRVGKYKSAVEPFILNKMSIENKEQYENLLTDLWQEFLTDVGRSRNLSPSVLQKITDEQGIVSAEKALEYKLVDKISYMDEVLANLKELTSSPSTAQTFRQIDLTVYDNVSRKSLGLQKESSNQIAVVYAEGNIIDGSSDLEISGDRFAKQLRELRQDNNVKAIVLRINSPGGSATASEVIQREIILTRQVKPVVISMGTVAASGGYWISTYGDRIFAEPNTITGSIGVFGMLPNFQKIANDHGITWDTVKTGKYADLFTITRPKSEEEVSLIQKRVDSIYAQFINKVSESRKLSIEKVQEIAQGRVWSGIDAKNLGLVDEIGGLNQAIKSAADLAKLGDNWEMEEYPKAPNPGDKILEFLGKGQPQKVSLDIGILNEELLSLQEDILTLGILHDQSGVYARLPMNLRIE